VIGAWLGASGISEAFQGLLNFLGAVLAFFYRFIPNYGVTIILLTLAIRVLLLPLAIKQIRSMQAMQAIQPKMKEIQRKYKGDRQRQNEEMMALYKEHGVNPLSGCFPLLLQFPVLIALFAVLRVPGGMLHVPHDPASVSTVSPANSRLYNDILEQHTYFLGANLLCSASQAGRGDIPVTTKQGEPVTIKTLHCGKGVPVRIPYYGFMLLMIATTFVQQRQMTRASPAGNQQQQALTKVMPLLFGVWGFIFPAGLVVYWTTTNFVQIVQQRVMLGRQAPVADEEGAGSRSSRGGLLGSLRSLINPGADGSGSSSSGTKPRRSSGGSSGSGKRPPGLSGSSSGGTRRTSPQRGGGRSTSGGSSGGGSSGSSDGRASGQPKGGSPGQGQRAGQGGAAGAKDQGRTQSGGSNGRSRKKRRKR
jgi:YidC/Oxa1 family membrane protein insertase